jgi:hypothetical protein
MKCRGNQLAMRTVLVRALSFSAVAALTLNPALTPVAASDRAAAPVAAVSGTEVIPPFDHRVGAARREAGMDRP